MGQLARGPYEAGKQTHIGFDFHHPHFFHIQDEYNLGFEALVLKITRLRLDYRSCGGSMFSECGFQSGSF